MYHPTKGESSQMQMENNAKERIRRFRMITKTISPVFVLTSKSMSF